MGIKSVFKKKKKKLNVLQEKKKKNNLAIPILPLNIKIIKIFT